MTKQLRLASMFFTGFISFAAADITNWLTGEVIPGTENITPGPNTYSLQSWNTNSKNLKYADLAHLDLSNSSFRFSWLHYASFTGSNLTNVTFHYAKLNEADLSGANLTNVYFLDATLQGADFTDAIVNGTGFDSTVSNGFTKEQLYSTASYKSGDLSGIGLTYNYLNQWDLSNQNLTGAVLGGAILTGANLSRSNLTNSNFYTATLNGTNFEDSVINGADLRGIVEFGFTKEQLYSTASYKNKDLSRITFSSNFLMNWDFSEQNLTDASLAHTTLVGADFSDAIITGADFMNIRGDGLSREQLYSTASYQSRNLQGVTLAGNLSEWDLSGQNLISTDYSNAYLVRMDFSFADLRHAKAWNPDSTVLIRNTIRPDGRILGLNMLMDETLTIRNADLQITITDLMSLAEGSKLQFILDAQGWGSTVNVDAGLVPVLDGSIELVFAPEVDPQDLLGCTFRLFNWNDTLSSGQTFTNIITQEDLVWDTTDLYTTGEITLIPEPATLLLLASGAFCLRRQQRR